jgi:hypothetical protein
MGTSHTAEQGPTQTHVKLYTTQQITITQADTVYQHQIMQWTLRMHLCHWPAAIAYTTPGIAVTARTSNDCKNLQPQSLRLLPRLLRALIHVVY